MIICKWCDAPATRSPAMESWWCVDCEKADVREIELPAECEADDDPALFRVYTYSHDSSLTP
jgi:hypothetical protein